MLAFSAAGFIATSTSGRSPGVRMSWSAKCSWNDETPGSVPAGARISAGKFGSVERSLPKAAVSGGEPVAGELHAVAGVTGEPDDDPVLLHDAGMVDGGVGGRHVLVIPRVGCKYSLRG